MSFSLKQDLDKTNKDIKENDKKLFGLSVMQWTFTVATFAIYFSFTSVIFAGVTVWGLQDYLFSHATNVIALVWVTVVVTGVPLALSLGKHYNYGAIAEASKERNPKMVIVHSMIALALISGVYYEAISASANLQAKAMNAVDFKGNLATIMNSGNAVNIDSGLSNELSKASKALAQCRVKEAEGRERHCKGSQAQVDSLKEQIAMGHEASANSSANAVSAKSEALNDAVSNQAIPAAKWVSGMFQLSNDGGTMIIVIIAALLFELIHLTTVFSEIKTAKRKEELADLLKSLKNDYYASTGKAYSEKDYKDSRVIDLTDNDLSTPNTEVVEDSAYKVTTRGKPYEDSKIGFGAGSQTASNTFKYQANREPDTTPKSSHSFGFVPSQGKKPEESTSKRENPLNVPAHKLNVPAHLANVPAREKVNKRLEPDTRENNGVSEAKHEPLYRSFSELPTYAEGLCKYCGCELVGLRTGSRYCSTDHKNKYWNLVKPSSKRSPRIN